MLSDGRCCRHAARYPMRPEVIRPTENQSVQIQKEVEDRMFEHGNRLTGWPAAPVDIRSEFLTLVAKDASCFAFVPIAFVSFVCLRSTPGICPCVGDLLGLKSKSKETCLNTQSNILNSRSK